MGSKRSVRGDFGAWKSLDVIAYEKFKTKTTEDRKLLTDYSDQHTGYTVKINLSKNQLDILLAIVSGLFLAAITGFFWCWMMDTIHTPSWRY